MLLRIVYPDEVKQTLLFKLFVRLIVGVISRDRGKMVFSLISIIFT